MFAAVLGLILAAITFNLPGGVQFNFGTSGGPLMAGLVLGHFRSIGKYSIKVPSSTLE
ncbi:MAG: hypothetical protein ACOX2A_05440 [Tepidanaerobacteraceae bacterium]